MVIILILILRKLIIPKNALQFNMKKILTLLCIITLSSCGRNYYIQNESIDYSQYVKQDFFITEASSVSFSYEPVASVYTFVYTGKEKSKLKRATYKDGIEAICKEAKQKGANGIINLKYDAIYDKKSGIVDYVYIKGMAIKRN